VKKARTGVRRTGARRNSTGFERTWAQAQARLSGAEVRVEKEIRALARRMGIDTRQASKHVKEWNRLLDREVRKASRRIDTGLEEFDRAVKKEQRALGRMVDEAVGKALAALNIPTRREVQSLTRKVHQLSRKIDRYGR
jgi:molybdenum-dependent DNA-binding transcriptional regulator ModE